MNLANFLRDPISLLTAIGALLSALAGLIKAVMDFRKLYRPNISSPPDNHSHKDTSSTLVKMPAFMIGVVLLIISIVIFVGRSLIPPPPLNVQLTSQAWSAYNDMDYTLAMLKADECVSNFEFQAINQQDELVRNGNPMPPLGFVSKEEEQLIFSRGILNDVATCYLIKGQSLEKLNRINEAKDVYEKTLLFSYARTWDKSSGFWSPADAASNRLTRLP